MKGIHASLLSRHVSIRAPSQTIVNLLVPTHVLPEPACPHKLLKRPMDIGNACSYLSLKQSPLDDSFKSVLCIGMIEEMGENLIPDSLFNVFRHGQWSTDAWQGLRKACAIAVTR